VKANKSPERRCWVSVDRAPPGVRPMAVVKLTQPTMKRRRERAGPPGAREAVRDTAIGLSKKVAVVQSGKRIVRPDVSKTPKHWINRSLSRCNVL
jgi:hypothetical protein